MIHDTQSDQISQTQDGRPPSCHHNGFVAAHALGYIITLFK